MKFTEEKLEKTFTELLGQEGFSHHLGTTILPFRLTWSSPRRAGVF